MNPFYDFLLIDTPQLYKKMILEKQFVPKFLTFSNEEHQYFFVNEWDQIKNDLESDFMKFLLKKHKANCYSKGYLWINEKEEQNISLIFVDKNSDSGCEMTARVMRDDENKVVDIAEYKTHKGTKEDMIYGWLFKEEEFTSSQLKILKNLYDEINSKIIIRDANKLTKQ